MTVREFTDSLGVTWSVRKCVAPRDHALDLDLELRSGWLTFESKHSCRRLVPVPAGWERAPVHRLELWCRRAIAQHTPTSLAYAAAVHRERVARVQALGRRRRRDLRGSGERLA